MILKKSESEIQKSILKYAKMRDFCIFRMNTGGNLRATKKGVIMTPNQNRGFGDLFWLHRGRTYFIEVKTDKGVWSEDQKEFCKTVSANGSTYLLCRSLDAFIDFSKQVLLS